MFYSSDDEKKLFDELVRIDPKLGDIYYSGLVVLHQKLPPQTQILENPLTSNVTDEASNTPKPHCQNFIENPDRIAQSAHSMRELLVNIMREHPNIISVAPELSFKTKIQKLTDPQTGLPDHLLSTIEQLHDLHEWFLGVCHHGRYPSEQKYLEKVMKFTRFLRLILAPHYEAIQEIDVLIKKQIPERNDLEKLEFLMSQNTQSYRYFFVHAKGNWLKVLYEDGKYFKDVPEVDQDASLFQFRPWPESQYLEQVASEQPDLVQKIILDIPTPRKKVEKNFLVLGNFVGAALQMPPELGKVIAEKAIRERWHDDLHSLFVVGKLVELMTKLSEKEFHVALKVCNALLFVESDPEPSQRSDSVQRIKSIIGGYAYEKILKEEIPTLYRKDPDKVLRMLIVKLTKAIRLINKENLESNQDQDHSYMWRPAVEEHEQNPSYDIRSQLVGGIRRVLEESEGRGINNLLISLSILAKHNYNIFRRLEIYFYGRHPREFSDEINLLVIKYFDKICVIHEYYHMLKNSFPHLQTEVRGNLLGLVLDGPPRDRFEGTEEEFLIYQNRWKINKLSPIIEYLPALKEEYDSLVTQYGRSPHADFVRYPASYHVTYVSDLSDEMTVSEVMEFIQSYKIPQGTYLEEDGSGRKFRKLVEDNPEEYSTHAIKLLSCHGLFQFEFLNGLAQVDDKKLDWGSIMAFCECTIVTSPSKDDRILNLILDYFGDLLRKNLFYDEIGIPFDLRDKVWRILSRAIEIASSDAPWSQVYPNDKWDSHNISINSTIGKLEHALMQYATWCYHGLESEGLVLNQLVPEVKSLLDSKLKWQHSISTHAVLGYHFYNLVKLDEAWAKSSISLIFTHDERYNEFGHAAWDAYIFQETYPTSFDALFDEYVYRISYHNQRISPLDNLHERFAHQIGLIYLNSLDRSDELFEIFLEKSDPKLLENFFEWIGSELRDWRENAPPKMDVFKLLSYTKVKSNPNAGWLFLNRLMPKSERIVILHSILDEIKEKISPTWEIVEELGTFAEEYPTETIECVNKIIRHTYAADEMYLIRKTLENIFQSILETGHESAIMKMRETVNFLGSLGYDDFRRFLA